METMLTSVSIKFLGAALQHQRTSYGCSSGKLRKGALGRVPYLGFSVENKVDKELQHMDDR